MLSQNEMKPVKRGVLEGSKRKGQTGEKGTPPIAAHAKGKET